MKSCDLHPNLSVALSLTVVSVDLFPFKVNSQKGIVNVGVDILTQYHNEYNCYYITEGIDEELWAENNILKA